MSLSNKQYADEIERFSKDIKTKLPNVYYDQDGDCIELLVRSGPFYAERIDDLVTVYYSETNEEIIGCLIKGIKKVFDRDPKTKIILQAGKMRLSDFFLVGFLTQKTANLVTYQKLRECVERYDIETEINYACS